MTRSQPMNDAPILKAASPVNLSLYSRFVQRLHRRYADVLPLLAPGAPTRDSLNTAFADLQATGLETGAALRVLRQLTLERLAQGFPIVALTGPRQSGKTTLVRQVSRQSGWW